MLPLFLPLSSPTSTLNILLNQIENAIGGRNRLRWYSVAWPGAGG
jgi:hypothetical protein